MPSYSYHVPALGWNLVLIRPVADRDRPLEVRRLYPCSTKYHLPELDQDVELIRPKGEEDKPLSLVRRTVPDSVAIAGSTENPYSFDNQYKRGLKTLEERGQLPRDFSKAELAAARDTKVD